MHITPVKTVYVNRVMYVYVYVCMYGCMYMYVTFFFNLVDAARPHQHSVGFHEKHRYIQNNIFTKITKGF
jgi:hypothetical protein